MTKAGPGYALELERFQQRVGVLWAGIERGKQLQRLARGNLRKQAALLQHQPDAGFERACLSNRVVPKDRYGTRIGVSVALEDLDRSRLAGAIRTQEREDFTASDRERDAIDDPSAVVALDGLAHFNGRCRAVRRRPSTTISHNESASVLSSPQVWLPAVNAALIVISGICLVVGYACIRQRKVKWHRRSMLTASVFAALFLGVYVTRFLVLGSKIYPGEGISRVVYQVILRSEEHTSE